MIEEFINSNEGKTLEFKENLQSMQGIIKTIIAFANTAGGIIIIGVEDKTKQIIGIKDTLAQEERLASVINDSITPLIIPDIEILNYRNKELIIINVPHTAGPCYLKSSGMEKSTYVRLGSTNRLADKETLQILKNISQNIFYDETPYAQGKESDLDWQVIENLFKNINKKITKNNAESLGLLVNKGKKELPSFGGIILFGKNRLKIFPDAIIRCARFLGTDKENILDQADIDIYLPLALEEAIKFIQRNTRLSAEITELVRKDIPEYPTIAIREAILNAIVHADYAVKGIPISIAIFDNRIEITNPGCLPFGFTLEKAMIGTSRIRNRVIAKVFYQLKLIEQWGRGIQLIIKECLKHGLAEPKFEELNNQFRVTLYSEKISEFSFTPEEKKIVNQLKKKGKIKTKEAAALWQVTPRTARSRLLKLTQAGILRKTGTSVQDPHSEYVLNNY